MTFDYVDHTVREFTAEDAVEEGVWVWANGDLYVPFEWGENDEPMRWLILDDYHTPYAVSGLVEGVPVKVNKIDFETKTQD